MRYNVKHEASLLCMIGCGLICRHVACQIILNVGKTASSGIMKDTNHAGVTKDMLSGCHGNAEWTHMVLEVQNGSL